MSDETEQVDIEFDVEDKVSPKLSRMEKSVEKLDQRVGRISERFMRFGEVATAAAGVFGAAESIRGANEYLEHVIRIQNLTGMAADKAAGISEALQITGTSAEEVEAIFGRMTKKSALLSEENKAASMLAARYGVNLREGPEKSMLKISKLYEEHKIGAGQVGRIMGVQGRSLISILDAMEKGPDELKRMFAEAQDKNAFLAGDTIRQMKSYHEAVNRVGLAWKRLVAGVIVKLAPTLEKLAAKFEDHVEAWGEKAQRFGTFMVNHMGTIIAMAKTYAKLMFANRMLETFTGKGLVGNAGRAGKWLAESSPISGIVKGLSGLSKLGIIGVIIGGVIAMFSVLRENFNGIGDKLKSVFGGIGKTLFSIGKKIMGIFSDDSPLGRFFKGVGYAFLKVVERIGEAMQLVLDLVEKIIDALPAVFSNTSPMDLANRYKEARDWEIGISNSLKKSGVAGAAYAEKMARAHEQANRFVKTGSWVNAEGKMSPIKPKFKGGGETVPEAQVYQDFRGSRFDIKQEFAEGFDPDRIAAAFASDVSAIGERKLQSGFSPLFAVR